MQESLLLECIETSNKLINDFCFLNRSRISEEHFSRDRKMNFVKVVGCLLNFIRKPLSLEVHDFHELIGDEGSAVSKQAFSKARQHINPQAFEELLQVSVNTALKSKYVKRYKGYRAFAIDGTELEIEPTKENIEYFGYRGSDEKTCRARVSVMCELLDGIIIDAHIASLSQNERTMAKQHMEHFCQFADKKDLIILGRGYPSKELISNFFDKDLKFLMRLQKSFNSEIDNCKKHDFYIKMQHKENNFNVRVIKFLLPNGEEEVLITNLARNCFEMKEFKELYFLRWGIETKYNTIKNKMLIEHFTGKTRISIEQDFYATMYLTNLVAFVKMQSDQLIKESSENKQLKHEYQTNEKMLIGILKDKLILALLCSELSKRENLFNHIITDVSRFKSEIRPGRHFECPKDAHHRRRHRLKNVL
jgi:hypothetical protein